MTQKMLAYLRWKELKYEQQPWSETWREVDYISYIRLQGFGIGEERVGGGEGEEEEDLRSLGLVFFCISKSGLVSREEAGALRGKIT